MPPTSESYLQSRQNQATAELVDAEARLESFRAEFMSHYPACENAAQQMQLVMGTASTHMAADLRIQGRKAARGKAWSLKALVPHGKLRTLLWTALLLLGPWLSTHLFMPFVEGPFSLGYWRWIFGALTSLSISTLFILYFPVAVLYGVLVKWGTVRQGDRDSQTARDTVLEFGRRSLSLMHFGDKESGDSRHPYSATRAPWPEQSIHVHWNIEAKYGKLLGADFVIIRKAEGSDSVYALLHLPVAGQHAALIPIETKERSLLWKLQESLALAAASALAELVTPIRMLAQHGEAWSSEASRVNALRQRIKTLQEVTHNWTDVVINEPTLDQVLKLVDMFVAGRKPSPKGILLYGPPGTGKTLIARKLAKHVGCHFEAVNISHLKGQHIGSTAPLVKAVWDRCRKNAPALLFVDECESVFARRGGVDTDSFGNELVQTFLSEWDGFNESSGQVLVIGATNRRDILDDAVISRFTAMVEIGLPDAVARRRILTHELQQAGVEMVLPETVITETSGMAGRDLHTLVAAVLADHLDRHFQPDSLLAAIRQVRGKGSTQVAELGWNDIVLPAATLEEFESLGTELRDAEQLSKLGLEPPAGILLYGPPGTGKTQIARVLAGQSGLSFVGVSTADMKANYLGQSGSKVKALFERARAQAPCILFIDEIDIVAPSRDGSRDDVMTQEIVGQLLQELDGVASKKGQVFLLCASNHPDRIDRAVLSRLDRKIRIDLPDQAARTAILLLELDGKPLAFDASPVSEAIAEKTDGWSGRDLHKLVSRATRKAVNRARRAGGDASHTQLMAEDLVAALDEREAT